MVFTQAADHQPQTTTLMTSNIKQQHMLMFQFHPNLDLQLSSSTNININHVDDDIDDAAAAASNRRNSIAMAEEARKEAKREVEVAEHEYANAMRIRRLAQAELDRASAFKAHALQHFHSTILQITCHACKHHPPLQFGAHGPLPLQAAATQP